LSADGSGISAGNGTSSGCCRSPAAVSDPALLRRVRQHGPALVTGRPADRLHLQSDRRDQPVGGGRDLGRAEAGGASRAALFGAAAAADREGAGRGGSSAPGAPVGDGRARPRPSLRTMRGSTPTISSSPSASAWRPATSRARANGGCRFLSGPRGQGRTRAGIRGGAAQGRRLGLGDGDAAQARVSGKVVERRPPRPHELRRALPQHTRASGAASAHRRARSRLQPRRQQGAAGPGHRRHGEPLAQQTRRWRTWPTRRAASSAMCIRSTPTSIRRETSGSRTSSWSMPRWARWTTTWRWVSPIT